MSRALLSLGPGPGARWRLALGSCQGGRSSLNSQLAERWWRGGYRVGRRFLGPAPRPVINSPRLLLPASKVEASEDLSSSQVSEASVKGS